MSDWGTFDGIIADIAEMDAAASEDNGCWPKVLNRPRLHAVADYCLTAAENQDDELHQAGLPAALAACHKLATMRPEEVTDTVREALALGPGKAGPDIAGVPAYLTFVPRDDDDENYDQQTAFAESMVEGVATLTGGNGAGTTTCCIAKAVRFCLENPPPRKDTPFLFVSESYDMVMGLYDEKLDQRGHLPPYVVDRERIQWYKPNNNWPYRVPFKADEHGNNWVMEFKSFGQGRKQFQGRSFGGFCLIEQFDENLLTEIMRGCREYSFRGNKLAEFTPIDPQLSAWLEEMIRWGHAPEDASKKVKGARYLPDNFSVHYANTHAAMLAGHVSREWYEEFIGMIPEDMLDTRLRGQFASYEGLIYKGLNPAIHFVGDEVFSKIPHNAIHHRSVDWGAGPHNPFACLWGLRHPTETVWWIWDEIYCADQEKTTIDHLVDVYHKHPWKSDHMFYGRTFGDPSGVDNMRIASKLSQYVDKSEGVEPISFTSAYNRVMEGIEHVQYLLKPTWEAWDEFAPNDQGGTGAFAKLPRLYIHEANCPNLCRELRSYRWENPAASRGANPKDAKPQPLKAQDHAADALRYLTISHDRQVGATIDTASNHGEAETMVPRLGTGWRESLRGKGAGRGNGRR